MTRLTCAAALVALTACTGAFGERVREEFHQTIGAGGGTTVHVDNVAGSVSIDAWPKPAVDIRATKYGYDRNELQTVAIETRKEGDGIFIRTVYHGLHRGGVRYHITVPADASLQISNVAGAVDLAGTSGDVTVETQAGEITADVGRVAGSRSVDLRATTGAVKLRIAPDSSAGVEASSTVGSVTSLIPGVAPSRENLVGARANGTVGSGSARIRVETTTGAIALRF